MKLFPWLFIKKWDSKKFENLWMRAKHFIAGVSKTTRLQFEIHVLHWVQRGGEKF